TDLTTDSGADGDQNDPERKRRRRRSRRGRRSSETGVESTATQSAESDEAEEGHAFVSHETPAFNPQVLPTIASGHGEFRESPPATPAAGQTEVADEPAVPSQEQPTAAIADVPAPLEAEAQLMPEEAVAPPEIGRSHV